jgi:hypothetical protein
MQMNVCASRFVHCNMWRSLIHSMVYRFGFRCVQINVCASRFVHCCVWRSVIHSMVYRFGAM